MVSFGDGNRDFLLKFGEFLNMKKASGVQFVDPTKDHLFHPLQLWGIVKSAERIQAIRRSIVNLSNHSQIAPTGATYFYEAFGDPIIAASILNIINEVYRGKDHLAQIKALRDAPVDSKMLNNTLTLPHGDPNFIRFRNFVEDSCCTAVVSTYGSFTAFTRDIRIVNQQLYQKD